MTTWNPSDRSGTVFLSGGDLTANSTGTSAGGVRSTDAVNVGKIYFEVYWDNGIGSGTACGITRASAGIDAISSAAIGALVYADGSVWFNGSSTGINLVGSPAASLTGTVSFAVDFTASRLWARFDGGNWNNDAGANPATNTGGIDISAMFPTNAAYACATFNSALPTTTINFGANTFAYAAPSGFEGWYAPPTDGSADASLTQTLAALTLSGYSHNSAPSTATSYTNPGGTGNRSGSIVVTTTASITNGTIDNIINGTYSNTIWFAAGQSGREIKFDFGTARLITEAKWYQDLVATHGSWKWQGSADNSSWTDIGGTFTLGSPATQTITTLSGNTTAYRYYRMLQTSGTTSSANYLQEIEFSIDDGGVVSTSGARLTQIALEQWVAPLADAQLTQIALELWGSVATTTVGTGLVTATFSPATLTATGVLSTPSGPNTGRLAPFTFASATLTATGTVVNHGVLDQTLAPVVLNPPALGVEKYGALAKTLDPLTLAGAGTGLSATLDAILAALTLAGTGGVAKTGRLERTLQPLSLAGTGALANRGTLDQTLGALTLAATNSPRTFFMAWTDEASGFDSSMLREDESVFAFEIIHEESDFPSLRLDVRNPKVGLLAAGRNQWVWFSWRDPVSGEIVPLFHGRLVGIPEDLHDEIVRLQFVARPSDYIAWKSQVAEGLKVRPFWDAVWIAEGDTDPDTVLEARPAAWHIDRVSLAVTASDTIIGEDGTLAITADDHFYDALKVSYGDTPLRRVDVTGTVTWTQEGTGVVDLTQQVYDQFRFAGSPYEYPMVSSFTGDGLLGDWPAPGDSIGGGWSMDATALALQATWQNAWLLSIAYVSPVLSTAQEIITPGYYQWGGGWAGAGIMGWKPAVTRDREFVSAHETIGTVFPLLPISTTFTVRWEASRARTEIVKFAMAADTQPLLVDPADDELDKLDLSSDFVGQPVDPGGALPIGSLLRNSYFNTDRGNQSVEYLIMLARAKMLARARAVSLSVETPFGFATRLSCRMNAMVEDPRLPGGAGTGKITRYALSIDGDSGEAKAEITLGCTIGRGQTVTPDPGTETYGEPDWSDAYQAMDGATFDAGTGDILYESFDGMEVLDDDGLDLMRMTPDRVIQALTVWDGPDTQQNTLNSFYRMYTPPGVEQLPPEMGVPVGTYTAPETPTEMLSKIPTVVDLQLVPISNQSFETTWEPAVSALMVPKTIDLEAPYP